MVSTHIQVRTQAIPENIRRRVNSVIDPWFPFRAQSLSLMFLMQKERSVSYSKEQGQLRESRPLVEA